MALLILAEVERDRRQKVEVRLPRFLPLARAFHRICKRAVAPLIEQIQKFLGHSKLETTQIYAESTTEMLKESYRRALTGSLRPAAKQV